MIAEKILLTVAATFTRRTLSIAAINVIAIVLAAKHRCVLAWVVWALAVWLCVIA